MQRSGFVIAAALALAACGKDSLSTAPLGAINGTGSVVVEAVGQVYIETSLLPALTASR